jgi:hypothetical protein
MSSRNGFRGGSCGQAPPLQHKGRRGRPCVGPGSGNPKWPRAFTQDARVEQALPGGAVRLYVPMLDGSERVGVLAFTFSGWTTTTGGSLSGWPG